VQRSPTSKPAIQRSRLSSFFTASAEIRRNWLFTIPALAANYHVIAPDQIGFGKSDRVMLKYRVGTYVDFLDKFMSELKIEKASLVGNSLGGWVAAWTAIKYPNRVEKIILADAAGLKPAAIDMAQIYSLNYSTRDEVRQLVKLVFFNQALFGSDAFIEQSLGHSCGGK
jgi:pimeloyl-ACP methyl ester carboxylesterase